MNACRICGEKSIVEFFDFARQPLSNSFADAAAGGREFAFRLAAGFCTGCTMAQQLEEAPRDRVFPADYPYRSSESAGSRRHFTEAAKTLIATELTGSDPFIVEIGSNDGIMLRTVKEAGIRHLGVDPAKDAAELAAAEGVRVRVGLFAEPTALEIRAADGPANVVYSANTISHIPGIESIFDGVRALLAPGGVFVFEDRYVSDIVENTYFDQIYDAHFYLFAVRSVQAMAARFGFDLIDAEHLPVHGGSIRYTVARSGERRPRASVGEFLARERERNLSDPDVYRAFGARARATCGNLTALLRDLRAAGRSVVGYGATAKSATVTNYCGIGPDLVPFICDSTPAKQGTLTPGSHIPVRPPEAFSRPYPDYALLFAWNHAEEIMAKERGFRDAGGKWILYVPDVHIV
ncbi:methyltransferase domain-containing protein [Nocardiopsis sediminis]|uniref:Methyltransferase domain-containing protein n=1 Tax=Nocardiopsis sediminis TaxID=1778267 RepID=A0ABV8FIF2_9ACTN